MILTLKSHGVRDRINKLECLEVERGHKLAKVVISGMKLERKDTSMELLDEILDKKNLHEAVKRVRQNGGTFGVDKMGMEEATVYFFEQEEEI